MNSMLSPSALLRSPSVSRGANPHLAVNPLAGILFFGTYIRMMDDDIRDESLVLEDFEDGELEEDEKY